MHSEYKHKRYSTWRGCKRRFALFGVTAFVAVAGVVVAMRPPTVEATVKEGETTRYTLGHHSIKTNDGKTWQANGYSADGNVTKVSQHISHTNDQELYQTQRTGLTHFDVSNLPEGRYKVALHFADTTSTYKNQRVFSINAEGKKVQKNLDIWRKSGGAMSTVYVKQFNVTVDDGTLDIDFKASKGSTVLSAVEVTPRKITGQAPSDPKPDPTPKPNPKPDPKPDPTPPPVSGDRTVKVSTSNQLSAALNDARAGDVILLADGVYKGKISLDGFSASFGSARSGTANKPIVLRGSKNARIEAGGHSGTYGLYLADAAHWRIEGVTVASAAKGIVIDRSSHVVIDSVHVTDTGQEGVHFRVNSTENTVQNSIINHTGLKDAAFGEGVYIGSAKSNWGRYSDGKPDRSDRNRVLGNTISATGAESIDIKEGSTGGIVDGNTFDGAGMTGAWADSWIDVKGNDYRITNNTGKNAKQDGFQVHVALDGWGNNTYFAGNTLAVNGPGYGLSVQSGSTGTVWKCSNRVTGAASGDAIYKNSRVIKCDE